jgi:phage-related protein
MIDSKPVEFRGSALDDLRAFPAAARREAGYQLDQIQRGREPDDWKPMNAVGRGVREIRIRDAAGAFRTEAALLWFAVNKLAINLSADFVDDQYFKVLIVP